MAVVSTPVTATDDGAEEEEEEEEEPVEEPVEEEEEEEEEDPGTGGRRLQESDGIERTPSGWPVHIQINDSTYVEVTEPFEHPASSWGGNAERLKNMAALYCGLIGQTPPAVSINPPRDILSNLFPAGEEGAATDGTVTDPAAGARRLQDETDTTTTTVAGTVDNPNDIREQLTDVQMTLIASRCLSLTRAAAIFEEGAKHTWMPWLFGVGQVGVCCLAFWLAWVGEFDMVEFRRGWRGNVKRMNLYILLLMLPGAAFPILAMMGNGQMRSVLEQNGAGEFAFTPNTAGDALAYISVVLGAIAFVLAAFKLVSAIRVKKLLDWEPDHEKLAMEEAARRRAAEQARIIDEGVVMASHLNDPTKALDKAVAQAEELRAQKIKSELAEIMEVELGEQEKQKRELDAMVLGKKLRGGADEEEDESPLNKKERDAKADKVFDAVELPGARGKAKAKRGGPTGKPSGASGGGFEFEDFDFGGFGASKPKAKGKAAGGGKKQSSWEDDFDF